MTARLHDFVNAHDRDDDIAGYLDPPATSSTDPHRFLYWRSSTPSLPAFVNCLEGGGDMRRIYTARDTTPWVRPRGPGVKRRGNLRPDEGDGALVIEPVPMTSRRWPARIASSPLPAPLSGGLHAVARALTEAIDGTDDPGAEAMARARLLHPYALAARTLVEASAASGFSGVHDHVGALLVDDRGAILAAGINTGSYRHAEVSLVLSWFRDHPAARTLPPRAIVLSTLTPCRQCTRYLSLAKAPDTVILFDEADTGRSGRAGTRIATQLCPGDARCADGASTNGCDAGDGAPADETKAPRGSPSPADAGLREAERRARRNAGSSGTSRIDRARAARRAIHEAARAVDGASASREDGMDDVHAVDDRAEAAILAYLAAWLPGAVRVE